MCGIVGVVRTGSPVEEPDLVAMRDAMRHRGPDDAGTYFNADRSVGLGHRRLSIIDLSPAGHQPMTNEDGSVWIAFNGEIYNFQSVRDVLLEKGHAFRSRTDTEVIIHAYEEWGMECLHRLRGMFAFAIWDENRRRLFLARDRLGIKPLYYAERDDGLSFASELKGLVAQRGVHLTVDESAIYDFFTYSYVPTPKTIYREVRKLPPGHYAVYEDGKLRIAEYWDVNFAVGPRLNEQAAAELLVAKLAEAVESHLVADVPVGVMLSGGLDSSSIAALAASGKTGLSHTFTIGFDVEEHDERRYARLVAERYKTQHRELQVNREDAGHSLEDIIGVYDEPFADSSTIPTLAVCALARREVTVALSGEGGDEIFGGYSRYTDSLRLSRFDAVPAPLRKLLFGAPASLLPAGARGRWTLRAAAMDSIERYAELLSASPRRAKSRLFAPDFMRPFRDYDDYWYLRKYWRDDLDPLSRMQYLDLKTYLHDDILTKMDRASMAASLEARVPLLDHELVDTMTRLPADVRNRGHEKKYLLKVAMRPYLPAELLTRKKQGFSAPFHSWLKGEQDLGRVNSDVFDAGRLRSEKIAIRDFWRVRVMNAWLAARA